MIKKEVAEPVNLKAFQIYFDVITKADTYPDTIKVRVKKGNKYFENKVILETFEKGNYGDGYVTFLSSCNKFRFKTGKDIQDVRDGIERDKSAHAVYCFGRHGWDNVWKIGSEEGIHGKEFSEIGNKLFKLLGYDIDVEALDTMGIYSNYWVCTAPIFAQYCTEILKPTKYFMEHDLKELVDREVNYPSQFKRNDVKYTWHTFIMERLFTTFCTLNNIIPLQI